MIKIIVSTYALYPDQKSSEAIVNKNWVQILAVKQNNTLHILSALNNYFSKSGAIVICKKLRISTFLAKQINLDKGIWKQTYRVINKLHKVITGSKKSLKNSIWIKQQSRELLKLEKDQAVVWSRILPVTSLEPLLAIYKNQPFPLIVNVNDPIDASNIGNGSFNEEEHVFYKTKDIAQAWTFPSSKLADKMAIKYSLDRNRCFVIPHAMAKVERLYKRELHKEEIDILYTGTFYKSAFTDEFKRNLKSFVKLKQAKFVTFTFVLSQYDEASISWLKESIPNVKLKFKLKREDVLKLVEKSDCMLVVDSILHIELLKGKLVEAISYGIPVLSITYPGSVMDNVVNEYGGISAYHDVEDNIIEKFIFLSDNLRKSDYLKSFYVKRQYVIDKISEERILKKSIAVSQFAWNRFNNKSFSFNELNIEENMQWP